MKYDPSAIIEMIVFLVCLEAAVLWPVFALQQSTIIAINIDTTLLNITINFSNCLYIISMSTCKDDKLTFGSKLSVSIILTGKYITRIFYFLQKKLF